MKTIEVLQGQAGFNKIINGDFTHWRRGTTFTSLANDTYSVDRLATYVSGPTHDVVQSTDVPSFAESGYPFQYSYKLTSTGAYTPTTTGYGGPEHRVEGYNYNSLINKTNTLSFWVKNSVAGTYSISLRSSSFGSSYVIPYTVDQVNTWERKVLTFTHEDLYGTWDHSTGIGLRILWSLTVNTDSGTSTTEQWLSGNSFGILGQTNFYENTGNVFYLTGVMLHEGKSALDTFIPSSGGFIQNELILCQRYYYHTKSDSHPSTGDNYLRMPAMYHTYQTPAASAWEWLVRDHPTLMRIAPSFNVYDTLGNVGKVTVFASQGGSLVADRPVYSVYADTININVTQYTESNSRYGFCCNYECDAEL